MRTRDLATLAVCAAFALIAAVAGLAVGSTGVSSADVWAVLTGGQPASPTASAIVQHVRVPRAGAALLAGAPLAVSGAVIQTVLNNPLASPNIIGVNSGAGLAVLICAALLPGVAFALPLAAFAGALVTALIIFAVAARGCSSRLTLMLVGMAVSTVFGAGMNAVLIVAPDAYVGASTFLVGGLSGVRSADLLWPAVFIAMGLLAALLGMRALNVCLMGDAAALSVGMDVGRVRLIMLGVAALLAGAAVSFAGLLGFVGLIVPHVMRLIVGNDLRVLVPTSALAGAGFVCLCDMCARTLFTPYELPVGILMAFVGGPFFIWLVVRSRGGLE